MAYPFTKSSAAWLSVVSNTTLVVGKLAIGVLIGSVSVLAEAIHSGIDLFASVIALFAVKTSSKPADADHPFGHGKIENISGAVEALLIFLAAGWIIYEAVGKLMHPAAIDLAGLGIAVMLVSSVANWIVSRILFKVGKATDSIALMADGWHLRTDVYTSVAVLAGLSVIWLGGRFFASVNVRWIDPAAAILVALLILHAAYKLVVESARDLLDARLPAEEEEWVRRYIAAKHPTVRAYHKLRTRKSGPYRFVEFHLLVDAGMSVEDSHKIADEMSHSIENHFSHANVTVHIEPCNGRCKPDCIDGCLLSEQERTTVRKSFSL